LGVPRAGIWNQALGLSKTTIERVDAEQDTNTTGDDDTRLVIHVRPTAAPDHDARTAGAAAPDTTKAPAAAGGEPTTPA
jgi:hypothetical protein